MSLHAFHAPLPTVVGSGTAPRGARVGAVLADPALDDVLALHGPRPAAAVALVVARKVAVSRDAEGSVAAGVVDGLVRAHDCLGLCGSASARGAKGGMSGLTGMCDGEGEVVSGEWVGAVGMGFVRGRLELSRRGLKG
jgi:hypothetical protein